MWPWQIGGLLAGSWHFREKDKHGHSIQRFWSLRSISSSVANRGRAGLGDKRASCPSSLPTIKMGGISSFILKPLGQFPHVKMFSFSPYCSSPEATLEFSPESLRHSVCLCPILLSTYQGPVLVLDQYDAVTNASRDWKYSSSHIRNSKKKWIKLLLIVYFT